MTRVIGLDLSTTSTGLALPDGTTRILRPGGNDRAFRISIIKARLESYMRLGADVAVIEKPTVGRGGIDTLMALGDIHGPVRNSLYENNIQWVMVVGSTLKKFATGDGSNRTDKDDMVVAAQACGVAIDMNDHDAADAWWLRAMGDQYYNGVEPAHRTESLRPARQEALLAVKKWPQFTLRTANSQ